MPAIQKKVQTGWNLEEWRWEISFVAMHSAALKNHLKHVCLRFLWVSDTKNAEKTWNVIFRHNLFFQGGKKMSFVNKNSVEKKNNFWNIWVAFPTKVLLSNGFLNPLKFSQLLEWLSAATTIKRNTSLAGCIPLAIYQLRIRKDQQSILSPFIWD